MLSLPKRIIEQYSEGVEHLRFFGVAASELNRQELLAMANFCAQQLAEERKRHASDLDFLLLAQRSTRA